MKMNQTTSSVLNKNGKIGEALLTKHLTQLGYECFSAPPRRFSDWDIRADKPDGTTTFIEVKTDVTGMFLKNRRGFNFYIEMFNTKQSEPSGIFKSKANKYAYFFLMPNNAYDCYVFDTRELRNYLCENPQVPVTGNTIEGNAAGWLLPNTDLPKLNHTILHFDRDGNYDNIRSYTTHSNYTS